MRTTLDLPDAILQRAKTVAVERGTTLRDLVRQALVHELGLREPEPPLRQRAQFPIFYSTTPGTLDLSEADIAAEDLKEDKRQDGLAG